MDVVAELEKHIDSELMQDLVAYYQTMKTSFIQRDWEKASLNGGKYVETITRILQHLTSGDDSFESGDLRVDLELRRIMSLPSRDHHDSLRLRIPRVALAVYDVRNNRNIAHSHREIDPNYMDSFFVGAACDWILVELLRLYLTDDVAETQQMIRRILERQLPFAQQIEGDIVVLDPDLTYKEQLLVTLYMKHPKRVTNQELRDWTKPRYGNYVPKYLSILEQERMVHRNGQGNVLTLRGLRHVEEQIAKTV